MKNDSIFIEYSIIPSLHDMEIQLAQTLVKRQNCFWKAPTCTCNTVTKHQCHVKCLLTCLYMILFSKHPILYFFYQERTTPRSLEGTQTAAHRPSQDLSWSLGCISVCLEEMELNSMPNPLHYLTLSYYKSLPPPWGLGFRLEFHIYLCQVKPRKNKAMFQIYVHTSVVWKPLVLFKTKSSFLADLSPFWCSQTVLLVKSLLVKSLRYLGIFH